MFSTSYPMVPAFAMTTRCTFCDAAVLKKINTPSLVKSLATLYGVSPKAYNVAIERFPKDEQSEMRKKTLQLLEHSVAKGTNAVIAHRIIQTRRATLAVLASSCAMPGHAQKIRNDSHMLVNAQVLRKRLSVIPVAMVASFLMSDVGYVMTGCKNTQVDCQLFHHPLMKKHPRIDGRSCEWAISESTYRYALLAHARATRELLLALELHERQLDALRLPVPVRRDILRLLRLCLEDMMASSIDMGRFPSTVL